MSSEEKSAQQPTEQSSSAPKLPIEHVLRIAELERVLFATVARAYRTWLESLKLAKKDAPNFATIQERAAYDLNHEIESLVEFFREHKPTIANEMRIRQCMFLATTLPDIGDAAENITWYLFFELVDLVHDNDPAMFNSAKQLATNDRTLGWWIERAALYVELVAMKIILEKTRV